MRDDSGINVSRLEILKNHGCPRFFGDHHVQTGPNRRRPAISFLLGEWKKNRLNIIYSMAALDAARHKQEGQTGPATSPPMCGHIPYSARKTGLSAARGFFSISERVRPLDKPVFDVANDNVPADLFLASTNISAKKIAAREELAVAMAATSVRVTVCKPVDRPEPTADGGPKKSAPRMAFRGEWLGDEFFPESSQSRLDTVEVENKRVLEQERLVALRQRIAARQSIGNPANDNREPISWPFLGSLRRAGQHEDAQLIEYYRGLCAIMEANPLQGQDIARTTDSMVAEDRSEKLDLDDIEEAAAADWKKPLKSGEIAYKGTRQRAKAPGTAGRAKSTTETTVVKMHDLSVKFSERVLIAQIDMRDVLPRLRRAMGLLVSPFEDAVLGGLTMMEIGEARHFRGKQAEAAGKVLVMTALDAVRAEWADIREGKRHAEQQAQENVERRRTILNARQIAFLMRAA